MGIPKQNSLIKVAWKSDRGLLRTSNEDSVLVDRDTGLFTVADGMGGHKAGDVASRVAVQTLSEVVRLGFGDSSEALSLLHRAILQAHQAIMSVSKDNPDCEDMGTTLVAALWDGNYSFVIGHVGDSRAYFIHQDTIKPLTRDHTFLAEWLEEGTISPEATRVHPARHGLYMALGVDDELEPEMSKLAWSESSSLLLCSDGLSDIVDEHDILTIVRDADSLELACEELIARANQNGGEDNCSVVLVSMR